MTAPLDNREWEKLSAYLDGQLSPREQQEVEQSLKDRAEYREGLAGLRMTRAMLRAAPRKKAPRNFTLTRAMVGDRQPVGQQPAFFTWFPALRLASVLTTLAFVLSFAFEMVLSPAMSLQPLAYDMKSAAPMMANGTAAEEHGLGGAPTPPIITWGPPENDFAGQGISPSGKGPDGSGAVVPQGAPGAPKESSPDTEPARAAPLPEVTQAPAAQPPAARGTPPLPAASPAPQKAALPRSPEGRESGNPILGLPSTQDAGKMILPTTNPVIEEPDRPVRESINTSAWRGFQGVLILLALVSGIGAAWMWWRHRS